MRAPALNSERPPAPVRRIAALPLALAPALALALALPWPAAGEHVTAPAGGPPSWRFFEGVGEGDWFEYRVCDGLFPGAAGASCYRARIEVAGTARAGASEYYLVHAATRGPAQHGEGDRERAFLLRSEGGRGPHAVLHAEPGDREHALSLQRTVFWDGWGAGGDVELSPGSEAFLPPGAGPRGAMRVDGPRADGRGGVAYQVSQDYGPGSARLSAGHGLPLDAAVHGAGPGDPRLLFALELLGASWLEPGDPAGGEGRPPEMRGAHHALEWRAGRGGGR